MSTIEAPGKVTYTIIGGDGNEYGPVGLDQILAWIQQNRIRGQSQLRRSDQNAWARADSFPELDTVLKTGFPAGPSPAAAVSFSSEAELDEVRLGQVKSGASWFYWIAGLSLVNSILALFGSEWGFILGLGVTQILDGVGALLGTAGKAVAFTMSLVVAGGFVGLGAVAQKGQQWAFIVGMVLYALDALLFLIGFEVLGLGFHGLALFFLFRGFKASQQLRGERVLQG